MAFWILKNQLQLKIPLSLEVHFLINLTCNFLDLQKILLEIKIKINKNHNPKDNRMLKVNQNLKQVFYSKIIQKKIVLVFRFSKYKR